MPSNFFRLIKLASPKLNYLIGIGAIILYVTTIFLVGPTTSPGVVTVLCNLTPWLTAIGYSLCYGTILAKMTRVYYIFNNPSPKKKVSNVTSRITALNIYQWNLSVTLEPTKCDCSYKRLPASTG